MATITQNLAALQQARTDIAEAIENKGVTLEEGAGFTDFPQAIEDIPTGVDTSNDTVTPATLAEGVTAHNAAGNQITGTMKKSGNVDVSTSSVTLTDSSPTATVTLSNATGTVSIASTGDNYIAELSNNTITISRVNPISETAAIYIMVAESSTTLAYTKIIQVTTEGVTICTWSGGTDTEIANMIQAHRDGFIDLTDYWAVGDVRTVGDYKLYLLSGSSYYDVNNNQKNSIFNILADGGNKVKPSYFLYILRSGSAYKFYVYINYDYAQTVLSYLPTELTDKLLTFTVKTAYHSGSTDFTWFTKASYAGNYISVIDNISTSNRYYTGDNYYTNQPLDGKPSPEYVYVSYIYYVSGEKQVRTVRVTTDDTNSYNVVSLLRI